MNRAPCRSCGQTVLWVNTSNGRRMPLDAQPSPKGNLVIVGDVAYKAGPTDINKPLYLSHFATCPQAGNWRKS